MRNYKATRELRYRDRPPNLTKPACQRKVADLLANPDTHEIKNEYNHDDVRKGLRKYFGKKCIYCEAEPIATSTFRVDHYRPKSGIKDVAGHRGYYWLGYEWSNFLQSCQLCNGPKSNQFPLADHSPRVSDATPNALNNANWQPTTNPLNTEQRLLLHPELDDVEGHFIFTPDGQISSNTKEGLKSIICYDLNRYDLILSRKKIIDEYLIEIKEALKDHELTAVKDPENAILELSTVIKNILRRILKCYLEAGQFSLMYHFMFDQFDVFFANRLELRYHHRLVMDCYSRFLLNISLAP